MPDFIRRVVSIRIVRSQYKSVVDETLALANKWHERISQGYIPTSREAAEFRDQMADLHRAAREAWHRYCENDRDYEIPD